MPESDQMTELVEEDRLKIGNPARSEVILVIELHPRSKRRLEAIGRIHEGSADARKPNHAAAAAPPASHFVNHDVGSPHAVLNEFRDPARAEIRGLSDRGSPRVVLNEREAFAGIGEVVPRLNRRSDLRLFLVVVIAAEAQLDRDRGDLPLAQHRSGLIVREYALLDELRLPLGRPARANPRKGESQAKGHA